MRHFAIVASALLAATVVPPAPAQDNDAEKLFRDLEKKIQEAKAFEVKATITTEGDTKERVGRFKGSLIITSDNKARFKISGRDFGERRTWEIISDGKEVRVKPYAAMPDFREEATLSTPKNLHGYFSTTVSRAGLFPIALGMPYILFAAYDRKEETVVGSGLWDFKGAVEKLGGRNAQAISFKVGDKKLKENPLVTVWIDTETLLPLKRVLDLRKTTGRAGGIIITETYTHFTLEPKIAAKTFVLPKAAVLPEESVALEKLPEAVKESAKKRFPKAELGSAVLARPGSEWLRPDQDKAVYIVVMSERCDVPRYPFFRIVLMVTPEGGITEILKEIVAPRIPKELKEYLDKNYANEKIQEILELIKVKEGKEKLEYLKVFLSDENRTRVLLFSADGKFVKEDR